MTSRISAPVQALAAREWLRFSRQRARVVAAIGTPLLFWLFLGSGMGESFQVYGGDGGGYLEYFFPGSLLLVLVFASVFASMSVIEDRNEGFLQGVLVSPIPRSGIVWGKVIGITSLGFAQGAIFASAAPLAGLNPSFWGWILLVPTLFLTSFALSALGFYFAWRINSVQGFHGVMNILLFPLWLLSGALFPGEGAAGWMQWVMKINPFSYSLSALRQCLSWGNSGSFGIVSFALCLLVTGLLGGVFIFLSIRLLKGKKV